MADRKRSNKEQDDSESGDEMIGPLPVQPTKPKKKKDSLLPPSSTTTNATRHDENQGDPRVAQILDNQNRIIQSLEYLKSCVSSLLQHPSPCCVSKGTLVDFAKSAETDQGLRNYLRQFASTSCVNNDYSFSSDDLSVLNQTSSGPTTFADFLFRKLFTAKEIIGRNCCGVARKDKLDEKKLELIKEQVFKFYPDTPDNLRTWAKCIKRIDSYIRNRQRAKKSNY